MLKPSSIRISGLYSGVWTEKFQLPGDSGVVKGMMIELEVSTRLEFLHVVLWGRIVHLYGCTSCQLSPCVKCQVPLTDYY